MKKISQLSRFIAYLWGTDLFNTPRMLYDFNISMKMYDTKLSDLIICCLIFKESSNRLLWQIEINRCTMQLYRIRKKTREYSISAAEIKALLIEHEIESLDELIKRIEILRFEFPEELKTKIDPLIIYAQLMYLYDTKICNSLANSELFSLTLDDFEY
jgi:hypothetical protein